MAHWQPSEKARPILLRWFPNVSKEKLGKTHAHKYCIMQHQLLKEAVHDSILHYCTHVVTEGDSEPM